MIVIDSERDIDISIYDQITMKNTFTAYLYCMIICLSTLYSGLSLTLISASSIPMLYDYYSIQLSEASTLALLNGILPAGGMLGALLVPNLLSLATKKEAIYYLALASLAICACSLIPNLQVLAISRFLLGILNAMHMSLASAYIKDTFPPHIRKPFGAVYSTARILGMLTCYMIAQFSGYTMNEMAHIGIFMSPALVSVLQSALFWQVLPDPIVEAVVRKQQQRAKANLSKLYSPQNVENRYRQIRLEIASAVSRSQSFQSVRLANRKNLSSLHLAALRQFCGQVYIVIYAGQIMRNLGSTLADIAPVVINGIQLISGIIGIFTVQYVDRYRLLLSSTLLLAILNFFIGITDVLEMPLYCLITMTAFMVPNGAGMSSVAWSYPSELVPASQGKYGSFVNWTGSTIVAMVPPFIVRSMKDNSAYPVFFFFSVFLFLSAAVIIKLMPKIDPSIQHSKLTEKPLISS